MDNLAIEDMFAAVGPITIKRMFGGKGVYVRGVIIAIEYNDEILLKADVHSAPRFVDAGCRQWTYESKGGKAAAMPYWSIPESAFDDPELMATWVRLALDAGLRAAR